MISGWLQGNHGSGRPEAPLTNLNQMSVMGEKNHLGFFGQLAQDFESRSSTLIIKVDEQIVGYKRKSRRPIEVFQN